MSPTTFAPEGKIPFSASGEPGETWYKIIGDLSNQTQGPPLPSAKVWQYGQIGNSRSTHFTNPPKSPTFWKPLVDELENLITFLCLEKRGYYLLGHSWGGIVATEFKVRRHPVGLKGIVLSNSFPAHVQEGLKGGFGDLKKHREALEEFYKVHACRISPQPKEVAAGGLNPIFGNRETGLGSDPTSSLAMNTGALKDWSIVDRLHQVTVPCLIINVRYDISQDFVVKPFFDKINKVK
ncbi:Alpha/Beta hydrolase protein [Mycena galopus ATCC 62051]|nr:Alpha/Beta hydrolase protein [Mycena galopus ATCC 62051]